MSRVLALFEDPEGPSARLRFDLFRPVLERSGCSLTRLGIPRGGWARWRTLRRAREAEVVFVQRRLLPAWQVRLLRRWSARLVFDLDDAIGLRDRPPFESATRRRRLRAWLAAADAVVVGSELLREHVRGARGEIHEIPTTVQPPPAAGRPEPGRVLWVGQPTTFRYLQALTPFLREAAARVPGLRWVLLGAAPGGLPELDGVETPTWSAERERQELQRAALGLAPLADDPWTRGKCATRLHLCLSHGVPVVASAVGAQLTIGAQLPGVRLVGGEEDWTVAIEEMARKAHDPEPIRSAWADRYAPERWGDRWLRAVLGRGAEQLSACAAPDHRR